MFLKEDSCFKGENIHELKELIKTNCIMLILFSVILSKEFFSSEYINVIDEYLPFSIKYIESIKFKLRKIRKQNLKMQLTIYQELIKITAK